MSAFILDHAEYAALIAARFGQPPQYRASPPSPLPATLVARLARTELARDRCACAEARTLALLARIQAKLAARAVA